MRLDLSGIDDSKIDDIDTGPQKVEPGRCHVRVEHFGEGEAKGGDHVAKFEVLAHDNPKMVGRIHTEYFSSKSAAVWRVLRLAVVTGLISKAELRRCKESGDDPEIDLDAMPGRQLFIELEEEEYDGKKKIRISGGGEMLSLDDERAAGYPRHQKMLYRAPNKPKAKAEKPAEKPAAMAAASSDPYGD